MRSRVCPKCGGPKATGARHGCRQCERAELGDVTTRILARVERAGDCWLWRGKLNRGYGIISVDNRKQRTHRLMYEAVVGPIPPGLQLDHLCSNRSCANPAHLEPVTCEENLRRARARATTKEADRP